MTDQTLAPPVKRAPAARCDRCTRRARVAVRMFVATTMVLRDRLGQLPPEVLALPLFDVRCVEGKCKTDIPVTVGDALGYV